MILMSTYSMKNFGTCLTIYISEGHRVKHSSHVPEKICPGVYKIAFGQKNNGDFFYLISKNKIPLLKKFFKSEYIPPNQVEKGLSHWFATQVNNISKFWAVETIFSPEMFIMDNNYNPSKPKLVLD